MHTYWRVSGQSFSLFTLLDPIGRTCAIVGGRFCDLEESLGFGSQLRCGELPGPLDAVAPDRAAQVT